MEKINQIAELIEGAVNYSEDKGNLSITLPNGSAKTIIKTIKRQQEQIERYEGALKEIKALTELHCDVQQIIEQELEES